MALINFNRNFAKFLNYGKNNIFRKMYCSSPNDVVLESRNSTGVILLNRPKALNAINTSMVKKLHKTLDEWQNKQLIIVKGAGEKAFCAGGDVRAIAISAKNNQYELGEEFFRYEYQMNSKIGKLKVPYVALINGITMGGGVGISIHGKYRVATETTLFAMPETLIGFFPDVGGSFFLSKFDGCLGLFLALTGTRIKGIDTFHAKIATHYCLKEQLNNLEHELSNNPKDVEHILNQYHKKSIAKENSGISLDIENIKKHFAHKSILEIFDSLKKDDSKWAKSTLELLLKMSPTSLYVTNEMYKRGKVLNDLDKCLEMEFNAAKHAIRAHDFYEGIRALLIDKDQKPNWKPSKIEEVQMENINYFFTNDVNLFKNKL